MFSDLIIQDYKGLIDAYSDVPICGIVLDEFKNLIILPSCQLEEFRERIYGKNFRRYFKEQTGDDLIQTMFDMRYCPVGKENIRISAINKYFDIFRHSTQRVEKFVAEYSEKVFGECSFSGLHNTYHNGLQTDEIWQTGCNWWEIPRKYAQTDEDIAYPIRMGIACGCRENLVYDMYYAPDKNKYLEKAVRDARFGCRIHYHIVYVNDDEDNDISCNTGSPMFLEAVKPYEEKIELLNKFDPVMPEMELLVVFVFPALYNWYPDESARNNMDINGKLDIENRVATLWKKGHLNALAPSDAIADGRITMKDGYFDYCGHRFNKMLYLYPQYSKSEVISFLQTAINDGYDLKIMGDLTRDFDGNITTFAAPPEVVLNEDTDLPAEMLLKSNPITDGCVLEDGSVVITDYNSIANNQFCTHKFTVKGFDCQATFKGVFAVKVGENGSVEKIAAGNLKEFLIDGQFVLKLNGEKDYVL